MLRLPASPRARRRLIRWGALAGVLLVGVVIAVAIPGRGSTPSGPLHYEGPAQLASDTPQGHLTAADRRAINRTLDRFMPAALRRQDAAVVWSLAGPELKTGSTLAEWRRGNTPVPYYPPRETRFHDWSTIEVGKRYAVLNLLLHPKPPTTLGDYVFSIQVVKPKSEWLVNRIYTIAIMNPVNRPKTVTHEIGPADFAAPPPTSRTPKQGEARLGHSALVPIISILALVLLIPLTVGGIALLRARRWRRRVRAEARTELPPLPSSYFNERREDREKAGTQL
jgi:hypothetical protein